MTDRGPLPSSQPQGFEPLTFDPELCIGCNICIEVCQVDIMVPDPQEGRPPIVLFPDECWHDGSCVDSCPVPGAITLNRMPRNQVHVLRKASGDDYFI